ncbi:MAG: 4-alpha-glucanotransferase [Syntrophaceae bacterium PtaB.Bin038]|nr:MAG: 4-alpha-glucanotransferase [Syntrophaceae bacterium PtaB.Bin038]
MGNTRRSGILLHVTSLPTPYGIGDLGPGAYRFADFLHRAGQQLWQMLPLSPTDLLTGCSPYSGSSAFAGNPWLVSPEKLVEDGLLTRQDFTRVPRFPAGRVDYRRAAAFKESLLSEAWRRFSACSGGLRYDYEHFCRAEGRWLDEYATFRALKTIFGRTPWNRWAEGFRTRRMRVLAPHVREIAPLVEEEKFRQFVFFRQWAALRAYCRGRGIRVMGDLPCYVRHDSADVWGNPALFKLDPDGRPAFVAGVPPDYFSRTGQLWGNPVYDWDAHRRSRFAWWVGRVRHNLKLFDLLRIDHCRGLISYWEVPAGSRTAARGQWVPVPAQGLFRAVMREAPRGTLVAEDLGTIPPDVREALDRLGLPGMRVLLFAFGSESGSEHHAPHRHVEKDFVYTGTHDNNTARGWFETEARKEEKERFFAYLGRRVPAARVHEEMIRLAMMSVASTAIIPMQDVLGLGEEARTNRPAGKGGWWRWRMPPGVPDRRLERWLRELTETYGRV